MSPNRTTRALVWTVLCAACWLSPLARATEPDLLLRRYLKAADRWDVPTMTQTLEAMRKVAGGEGPLTDLIVQTAYLSGDYAAAWAVLEKNRDRSEFTRQMHARLASFRSCWSSFRETKDGDFVVRTPPGVDEILAGYCLPVLRAALETERKDLRIAAKEPVIVEFYPDQESFSAASTLPLADIERTGAVAICKFNRILVTTPRIFLQGYEWADTLAHELAHYLIIKKTGADIPVWLHEGIAKYEEARWRGADRSKGLTPASAALLADAVRENRLIPFAKFHPSIAKLESQRDAAVAYAQAVTFVHYICRISKESRPIAKLLERAAEGDSVEDALKAVAGASLDDLRAGWLRDLKTHPPAGLPAAMFRPLKAVKGRNTDGDEDQTAGLAAAARRSARLGDLLRQGARREAAVIEYSKAWDASGALVPAVGLRLGRCLVEMAQFDQAERIADELVKRFPDYVETFKLSGLVALSRGDLSAAVTRYGQANWINPFDPEIHAQLAEAYDRLGAAADAARERRVLEQIARNLSGG